MAECKKCRTEFEGKFCPECGTAAGKAPPTGDPPDADQEKAFRKAIREEVGGVLDARKAERKKRRKKQHWSSVFDFGKPAADDDD